MDILSSSEHELAQLKPSLFAPGRSSKYVDELVCTAMLQDFPRIRNLLPESYFLDRLGSAIFYRMPWLLNIERDLSSLNAIEFGCGRGLKAIPWSRIFKSYLGLDLDPAAIEFARRAAKATGRDNLEFVCGNAADCVKNPEAYGVSGKIDAIILYAVLEHMIPSEREIVLRLCNEVIQDGGIVILCETPNRLIPHDGHSTYLHFFQSLPPEIALQYVNRSPRPGAAEAVSAGEEALYRFGQGASYHEFDLWMSNSDGRLPGIVADGWSHWPICDETLRRDEIWLNDYIDAHGPLAPPAFARAWLDVIFDGAATPGSSPKAPRFPQPERGIETSTLRDRRFYVPDTFVISSGGKAEFAVEDGDPVILVDLVRSKGQFALEDAVGNVVAAFEVDHLATTRFPKWHPTCAIDLKAFAPLGLLRVRPTGKSSQVVSPGVIVR